MTQILALKLSLSILIKGIKYLKEEEKIGCKFIIKNMKVVLVARSCLTFKRQFADPLALSGAAQQTPLAFIE